MAPCGWRWRPPNRCRSCRARAARPRRRRRSRRGSSAAPRPRRRRPRAPARSRSRRRAPSPGGPCRCRRRPARSPPRSWSPGCRACGLTPPARRRRTYCGSRNTPCASAPVRSASVISSATLAASDAGRPTTASASSIRPVIAGAGTRSAARAWSIAVIALPVPYSRARDTTPITTCENQRSADCGSPGHASFLKTIGCHLPNDAGGLNMNVRANHDSLPPYGNGTLAPGIRSRAVDNVNGMTVHMLEAGFETSGRPAVLLLHGFPELAYSWRKVMLPLAAAGYHVIAPDQRGYGRTTGWDGSYDADPDPFRILNMVRDAIGLVYALGYRSVAVRRGARRRLAGRGLERADPARHLPLGGDDELAVRGRAEPAVRHRQRRRAAAPGADRRRARRRAREAAAPAQVLSELSAHARGQRRHAACAAGPARVLPRLLPLQERRLESEQAVSRSRRAPPRRWRRSRPTT